MVRALPVHAPARRAATKRVLALADSGRQIVDDIFLPGGLEELVARSSRRRTLAPSARLIAVTGYAQPEDLKVVAGGNVARDLSSQFYAPIGCPRASASQGGDEDDHAMPCKGCILVVDDDPDLRNALTECFEALGCTVVAAVDGVHAVECLGDSLKPCLALLDLNMPRLDGAGLAAFVRTHCCHSDLPIVSMSAGADRLTPPLVECHHSKPFEFNALLPSVERFCQDPDWLHGLRPGAGAR